MKQNKNFAWNYIYYKGEKFEELGEKIFKYSLVELEDSPIAEGSKTSNKLIDLTFTLKYDDVGLVGYRGSNIEEYVEKLMNKKMMLQTLRLPLLFGKEQFIRNVDEGASDLTDYKGLKSYYITKVPTAYVEYIMTDKLKYRMIPENIHQSQEVGSYFITTATIYAEKNQSGSIIIKGLWSFVGDNSFGKHGLLWSIYHYTESMTDKGIAAFIQPIV